MSKLEDQLAEAKLKCAEACKPLRGMSDHDARMVIYNQLHKDRKAICMEASEHDLFLLWRKMTHPKRTKEPNLSMLRLIDWVCTKRFPDVTEGPRCNVAFYEYDENMVAGDMQKCTLAAGHPGKCEFFKS